MNLSQVAEIELSYKREYSPEQQPKISTSEAAYQILISHWDENKIDFLEQAKIILLSRSNQVLGISDISSGGISGTIVDPRLVFVTALKANASSIILAHNHPSGNLKPSIADNNLTKRLINAGDLLEIKVFDHLIVTKEGYYSFTEELSYLKRYYNNYTSFEVQIPF